MVCFLQLWDEFPRDESAMVNERPVFEALKFNCGFKKRMTYQERKILQHLCNPFGTNIACEKTGQDIWNVCRMGMARGAFHLRTNHICSHIQNNHLES